MSNISKKNRVVGADFNHGFIKWLPCLHCGTNEIPKIKEYGCGYDGCEIQLLECQQCDAAIIEGTRDEWNRRA